jgi:hypothetical protein
MSIAQIHQNPTFLSDLENLFTSKVQQTQAAAASSGNNLPAPVPAYLEASIDAAAFLDLLLVMGLLSALPVREMMALFMFNSVGNRMRVHGWGAAVIEILNVSLQTLQSAQSSV